MAAKVYRPVKKVERPRPLRQLGSEASSAANNSNTNNVLNNIATNCSTINNNVNNNNGFYPADRPRISPEELLGLMEQVDGQLNNQGPADLVDEYIVKIHGHLTRQGPEMERLFPDHLEHYFTTYRQEVRDYQHISPHSMLRLLELIELRAAQWSHNPDTDNFYQHYLDQAVLQPNSLTTPLPPSASSQPSPTGEVLQSSGKYPKPTKIPGKNYFKDEVMIRNADSGKVMGIRGRRVHMIEQLSGTIISFQRVTSGAKDRLVQITGNNEDSIGNAKVLIEETIIRNASPDRDKPLPVTPLSSPEEAASESKNRLMHSLSMGDASRLCATSDVLSVGRHTLQVSSSSPTLLEEAMAVLEAHFFSQQPSWLSGAGDSGETNCFVKCNKLDDTSQKNPSFESWKETAQKESSTQVISHSRDFLLQCSQSPLSTRPPSDWPKIKASHPSIVRNPPGKFDPQTLLRPRKSASNHRSSQEI